MGAINLFRGRHTNDNGKWIAKNYNIYVYPLYDLNLYQFHDKYYDQFTDEILKDILNQCLTRKCSTLAKHMFLMFE